MDLCSCARRCVFFFFFSVTSLFFFRLQAENFILRVAAEFGSRKEQLVFLINNYDLMLSVYGERTAPALVRERDEFAQLLDVCRVLLCSPGG